MGHVDSGGYTLSRTMEKLCIQQGVSRHAMFVTPFVSDTRSSSSSACMFLLKIRVVV